jgi:peptidoglycan/xylan/chitin deacetylase (PgdA/CDA1 family)
MAKTLLPGTWETLVASLRRGLMRGGYVRTINFHNTALGRRDDLERQLASCQRHFSSVGEPDLAAWFETGVWHKDKPGLLPIFFEGYRNNYEVAAPLLERYGFVGWFFVPSRFPSVPVAEQEGFARAHHIGLVAEDRGKRLAMTLDELRDLARRHVVASHTQTHARLDHASSDEELRREIIESKVDLERELGREITTFAWLYGSEVGVNPRADRYLHEAGYTYLLSNYKIQKLRR